MDFPPRVGKADQRPATEDLRVIRMRKERKDDFAFEFLLMRHVFPLSGPSPRYSGERLGEGLARRARRTEGSFPAEMRSRAARLPRPPP